MNQCNWSNALDSKLRARDFEDTNCTPSLSTETGLGGAEERHEVVVVKT